MRGGDKLLEPVEDQPLLRRQVLAAMTSGCPVVVTLPPNARARRAALDGLPVALEVVTEASEGLAASLRHAVSLLADGQSLGLLLPDVPGIGASEILAVLDRFRDGGERRVTRAGEDAGDRPGTPVFLPHTIALRLSGLTGDEGGRTVLKGEPVDLVRFPDDRALRDLDTPEDWRAWRNETGHLS